MNSKIWFKTLLIVVVLSMVLVSCTTPATQAPATQDAAKLTEAAAAPTQPAAADATQPPASDAAVIKVGVLLPLTGQDALEGQHHREATQFSIDAVNNAGGIKCLNGAKLEPVWGDTQGKPEAGNAEVERLITKENVIAIMGSFHTGVTLPTTEIAEKYSVPYLVPNAIAGSITGRGLQYVFKTRVALESYAELTSKFAAERGAKTAVSLTSNITIGEEAKKAYAKSIPEAGMELLDEVVYTSGSPDLSDTILKIKAADPDVLFAIANTPDAILLVRQMQSLNYWPKMGMMNPGGGMADPNFATELKELSEGITFAEAWSPLVDLGDGQALNAEFEAKYGYALAGATATDYATTWLLAAALEKSCSTDPKALAEALRTNDFKEGPWNFMFPNGIKFDANGYVEQPLVVVLQLQNQKPVVVWPDDLATGTAVWPVPNWQNR